MKFQEENCFFLGYTDFMKKNFFQFYLQCIKDFFEASVNLVIFLPYFFSIMTLLKTLFSPWKNLVSQQPSTPGFSFSRVLEKMSFDAISRLIGFFMRLSVISFYFLLNVLLILTYPFVLFLFFIFLPFLYLFYLFEKTDAEKQNLEETRFIKDHLLNKENYEAVNQWFLHYYSNLHFEKKWWRLTNLMNYPPLARDWSVGYTPTLDQYVDDLTAVAYQNRIKSIHDREKEISQIERILSKSEEANVIIVGEEGVGKRAIVDSLTSKIYEGRVNNLLAYKRVLKLNLEKILTQSLDQQQRENIVDQLLNEASQAKNVILLIENFDKYIVSEVDRIDLTIPIEKYAKTNHLQILAISQPFFYQKFIYPNEKINRIFEKVDVYEIKKDEAEQVLLEKALVFEQRYRLTIPYETVKNTIDKSDFYITNIPFPEKAIALLDSACVLSKEKNLAVINPEIIDSILSEKTHIPTRLTTQIKNQLINLEPLLSQRVVQQNEAINQLASALRRSFLLIGKRRKPLATFLFLGPTGVGKTETAKAISQIFFGSEKYLIRFDMSLYQSQADIPNLIGSIQSGNPGLLTQTIRQNPYGVLLLDEIEKADKNLINIFLTIIDEGYFTDGQGKRVDCKNLIIIATSNAGSDFIYNTNIDDAKMPILSQSPGTPIEGVRRAKNTASSSIIDYLISQRIFSPEFLNRFDGVIGYQPLNQSSLIQIARQLLSQIAQDVYNLYRVKISVSEELLSAIINESYQSKFGARNLERIIRSKIEDQVAKLILSGKVKEGEIISL